MDAPARLVRLHPGDDVAVACERVLPETTVRLADGLALVVRDDIPPGHKVALRPLQPGDVVRKYGQGIGVAARTILPGMHVHTHNLVMIESRPDPGASRQAVPPGPVVEPATFEGYVRPDGRTGTRNYVGVVASVNCSATVVRAIARAWPDDAMKAWPHVDGVVPVTHASGCGMAAQGEGIELLRRTLRGYMANPNFAAVLVVGLGCEVNQVAGLVEGLRPGVPGSVATLAIQDAGGTAAAIEKGRRIVGDMLPLADAARRVPVPASRLVVGLQCGGSDGYSGISANPALGAAVDLLVRHGGTAVLSETPEIYGAEHLLTARAVREEVAEALMRRIRWWEDYTRKHGGDLNNNPSPGNKAGGITTIHEKSLGAVAKGGTTALMEVVEYAQAVRTPGLVFMDSPGYDPVSATGQVAAGANLLCFTTGRGSTYGCKPTPSVKIATNSDMHRRMAADMDFNAGEIIDGACTVAEAGERLFALMLATASGRRTASEVHGLGDHEFVPWQIGAVM